MSGDAQIGFGIFVSKGGKRGVNEEKEKASTRTGERDAEEIRNSRLCLFTSLYLFCLSAFYRVTRAVTGSHDRKGGN